MSFPGWRYADGTPGHGGDGHLALKDSSRCPPCGKSGILDRRETGYGTDCTCTACGRNQYSGRGDWPPAAVLH